MANKRIRTNAPDTVSGVQRRVFGITKLPKAQRDQAFQTLTLDTMVGIAEAGEDGCRAPDSPVEVAREVLRYGAEVYGDAEMWITWDESDA
jgi:hypothetical protein